ncbi:MAG: hypothetical protein AAEB43_05130, partial [Acidimicrobiales bacterium]
KLTIEDYQKEIVDELLLIPDWRFFLGFSFANRKIRSENSDSFKRLSLCRNVVLQTCKFFDVKFGNCSMVLKDELRFKDNHVHGAMSENRIKEKCDLEDFKSHLIEVGTRRIGDVMVEEFDPTKGENCFSYITKMYGRDGKFCFSDIYATKGLVRRIKKIKGADTFIRSRRLSF